MPKVVITMQKTIRAYMERSKWQQRKAAIKIVLFIRKHRVSSVAQPAKYTD